MLLTPDDGVSPPQRTDGNRAAEVGHVSREVLGALDDATSPGAGSPGSLTDLPSAGPATLRLDDPVDHGRTAIGHDPVRTAQTPGSAGSDQRQPGDPAAGAAADVWKRARELVRHPGSRTPAIALAMVAALVGGLLGAAVAQRASLAGREQNASISAWITYQSNTSDGSGTFSLFVVNSGQAPLTVTDSDLDGGIEDGRAPVDLRLQQPFEVDPGRTGHSLVTATSSCDAGPLSQGGVRDGDLRVTVATRDLREQVLSAPNPARMSLSSVDIYDQLCQGGRELAVEAELTSRGDGRLSMTLRSVDGDDHVVDLSAPDGVTLVTEPPLPVTVTGPQVQTVAIGMTVESCTQNNTQLLAGSQVSLLTDDEARLISFDQFSMIAWFAREIAKACGD